MSEESIKHSVRSATQRPRWVVVASLTAIGLLMCTRDMFKGPSLVWREMSLSWAASREYLRMDKEMRDVADKVD